jgi:hypothetical protein
MDRISLSPSKLGDFKRCPRCFYDSYASKFPRPRGIFPSLPGGMDLIMKKYVDQYRGKLPPALVGKVPGVLYSNLSQMNKWRNWRSGPTYNDYANNITLIGALDDCLVDGDIYIPLDWKTKGSEPEDDGSQYYQLQMDCYNLMLEAQGMRVREEAHLVYIYPVNACSLPELPPEDVPEGVEYQNRAIVMFVLKPYQIKCNKENALQAMLEAADCLRGSRPAFNHGCEWCVHFKAIWALNNEQERG